MGGPLSLWNLLGRTVQAFLPVLAMPDDSFAEGLLSAEEFRLYLRMDTRDRSHSIRVTRRLQQLDAGADRDLLAAALLHDVAKSLLPFNPWYRVIAHLYRPTGLPAAPLQRGLRGYLQLREHHERLGARMILEAGASRSVARLLEGMASGGSTDPRVRRLKKADSLA